MGDGAIGHGAQRQRDLLDQVIAQRQAAGDQFLQVEIAVGRPMTSVPPAPGRDQCAAPASPWPGSSGKTLSSEESSLSAIARADLQLVHRPILGRHSSSALAGSDSAFRVSGGLRPPRRLEQRIVLDLILNETVELKLRELQQPDRLEKLRRHHHRLALPQIEFGR
jgi:hypothetical protein